MVNMKKKSSILMLLALFALCTAFGCSDDTEDTPEDAGAADAGATDTGTPTDTDTGAPPVDTGTATPNVVAIDEDFNIWEQGDARFYMAKPDQDAVAGGNGEVIHSDNGSRATVDGHECLMLHANAVDNNGYGFSIEAQIDLDKQTDMRFEDFEISFDLYIPSSIANEDKNANVQFAFYEKTSYTPIYSKWWSSSIVPDGWATFTGKIDTTSGDIDYSGFTEDPRGDPGAWIFDAVRVQVIINGDGAAVGDEMTFYIDNLRVANFPDDGTEDTEVVGTDTGTEDAGDQDAGDADAGADAGM